MLFFSEMLFWLGKRRFFFNKNVIYVNMLWAYYCYSPNKLTEIFLKFRVLIYNIMSIYRYD